jgi:hypothetical protein
MSTVAQSPYENQEELAPIFVRLPGITRENALIAFRYGRRTAEDTLDVLVELGVFNPAPTNGEPSLLPGMLLSMAYGIDHLALQTAVQTAPVEFADYFCEFVERCVGCGYLTSEGGELFLGLFGDGGAR